MPDDENPTTNEEPAIEVMITARCNFDGYWVIGDEYVDEWGAGLSFSEALEDYAQSFRETLNSLKSESVLGPALAEKLMRMLDMEAGEPL